jgi:hypothetical protein
MPKVKAPFTSRPGRAFYGLVVQKGPWKSTYKDYRRAHQVPGGAIGGGVPVGGTGDGERDAVMSPYQQDGRGPLPEPSEHGTQSIVRPGESWYRKKPAMGGKRKSSMKAALIIHKKSDETNYEDISHEKGQEPDKLPPPPDLHSLFLTEDRLLEARSQKPLSKIVGVEMMDEAPTPFPNRMLLEDTPMHTFAPPSLHLQSHYMQEDLSRKEHLEGQMKKMKMMKGPAPAKLSMEKLPASKQSSTKAKGVRAEAGSVAKKKDDGIFTILPMPKKGTSGGPPVPIPKKGSLKIKTTGLPASKQSSTKAKGVRVEKGSVAKKKDIVDGMPSMQSKAPTKKVDRRGEIDATRREFRTMQNPTALRMEHTAELKRAFKHLKP